jgi:hypothetical protein
MSFPVDFPWGLVLPPVNGNGRPLRDDPDYIRRLLDAEAADRADGILDERIYGPLEGFTDDQGTNGDTPDRYHGRVLDVRALLTEPDEPIPWRCENLAADGYLTVLAGRGGEGKSWLALSLACGVARGAPAAGIRCAQGRALIFDAENGRKLIGRRFKAAAMTPEVEVQPVEAGGLNIARDLDWFKSTIVDRRANFVVFDSLKVLSTGVKENDAGEMEPIVTALKLLARDTGAAILLIHHRGRSALSEFRGSSVILDQTDLLFTLGRVQGDPESRTRRKITTAKCRIEEEPPPCWVQIASDRSTGLVYVNAAEPFEGDDVGRPRDTLRDDVLEVLGGIARSGRNIAKALDKPEPTIRRVLHDLQEDGLAERRADGWVRHTLTHVYVDAPDAPAENPLFAGEMGASAGASPADADPPADAPSRRPRCCCADGGADLAADGRCSRCYGIQDGGAA